MKARSITSLSAFVAVALAALVQATSGALARDDGGGEGTKLPRSILDAPGRPEQDRKQDAGRKALEVYEWLGIGPGMTVADIFCGGGYNTHLLSHAVGPEGKVYAVSEFYRMTDEGEQAYFGAETLDRRIEEGKLVNVERVRRIADLPAHGIDAMIAVRNYHDVEWVFDTHKRTDVVEALLRALKPGGVIGIVEVATPHEGWHKETHRLNEKVVIEDFEKGGFELAGRSDMLANPDDKHTTKGFEEGRYNQDRYLLKFRKPGTGM